MTSVPPPPPVDQLPGHATASESDGALPSWPAWSALAALASAFGAALIAGIFLALFSPAFGGTLEHPPPGLNIAATIVQDLAFVGAALLFARSFQQPVTPGQFGVRRTRLWPAVGRIALVLLVFYVASGVWAQLIHIKQPDELPDDLGVKSSTAAFVAVCVIVTVLAPIAEELLFRGYFFTALWRWRGPWVAALLTGAVFGAIHAGSAPAAFLVPLAFLGFLLCLLRWRTGSLIPCMAVHAFNNSIAFGVNEAHWGAWQTVLLIVGSAGVIVLGAAAVLRRARAWA